MNTSKAAFAWLVNGFPESFPEYAAMFTQESWLVVFTVIPRIEKRI
ncbi:MAG: hypothetical protein KGZ88_23020 [Methylomicrobium sp.]|nr:hypothetical protein [Methylomicrobium sp.]